MTLKEAHVCCALRPGVLEKGAVTVNQPAEARLVEQMGDTGLRHGGISPLQLQTKRPCVLPREIGHGLSHKTLRGRGGGR